MRILRKLMLCLGLCMLLVCVACGEKEVIVSSNSPIRGYQENTLTVTCLEDGELTLQVTDRYNVWVTICRDLPVKAGKNQVVWDGLAANRERIEDGKYTFSASLKKADGSVTVSDSGFTFSKCRQVVLFALPSSPVLYRDGSWYAEVKMIRMGKLVTEFYRAEDMSAPFFVKKREIKSYRVQKWEWEGKIGKNPLPAGDYVIRFYAEETPAYYHDVKVTIVDGEKPSQPVMETGAIMPERGAADEEIWTLMTAPAVVVNIKNTSSQKIYALPDSTSAVLGTLHGQSQTLEVKEVLPSGWCRIAAWQHEDGSLVDGYLPTDRLKVVQPQTRYGLLVDKREQTLTVFEEGKRLGTIQISTGLTTEKKLIRETAAGSFLTQEHMQDFSMNGFVYQYVIRYDGGNLLHSIAYEPAKGLKNYTRQTSTLGQKASHACIRIQQLPGEGGLNAYWIWTHIPVSTRVIVLDDAEQSCENTANGV